MLRLFNAIANAESFWRRVLRYGLFDRATAPVDWFYFRHHVNRECAIRQDPLGGPPKKMVEEVFRGITKRSCKIKLIRPTAYNVSWEEICIISQIIEIIAPKRIFEFGTFDGRTTIHLALNAPDDALTYTLDIQSGDFEFSNDNIYFEKIRVGEQVFASSVGSKIVMLTGDSKTFDFSSFMENVDFVFIDADHSYAAVINDSEIACKMVRPGGIVVWHDYLLISDVTKAIVDIYKAKPLVNLKGTSLVVWQRPYETTPDNGA